MKRICISAIAIALLAYGATSAADESTSDLIRRDAPKGITETFYKCIDKADYDTLAVATCLSAEEDIQDTRLNHTYKALLAKLDSKGKEQLASSERA